MRVLVDPETGELVEVRPEDVVGREPYDYEGAHAAVLMQTRERRELERQYEAAQEERADAEVQYRRALGLAMIDAKEEHGATMAEKVAKATPEVLEAKRRALIAEGMVHAKRSRLALCAEDRASIHRLIEWSRDVWRYENGIVGSRS